MLVIVVYYVDEFFSLNGRGYFIFYFFVHAAFNIFCFSTVIAGVGIVALGGEF